MATNTMKKLPRVKPKTYTTCLLYKTKEAREKLKGISLAACNPKFEKKDVCEETEQGKGEDAGINSKELSQLTVSETMSCNFCDVMFENRLEQKRHYRSDWHRYNLKLRLRNKSGISEEQFETISGNISSLSGSDTEDDITSDVESSKERILTSQRLLATSVKLELSSTDSESEAGNQVEEAAKRLPKVYFKNEAGELLSLYRCVIYHKKNQPSTNEGLISMTTKLPSEMNWAIFMAGGGHFAAAVFSKEQLIVHKTFHRYVVRAKRGTAQSSRDSQGNAPKSGGASLRRYNEAALTEEIQELITSWSEHIQTCDRIFLRAPSFNRKIFFGGKSPPFLKDDLRIRLIPFQTRRPTFNEVRRVYEMLASIECYGDETDIQEFIPVSPPQVFNRETGQLEIRDETQMSPKHRKLYNRKLKGSPLANEIGKSVKDEEDKEKFDTKPELKKTVLPDHVVEEENLSSETSTASEAEMIEVMQTISTLDLKEFGGTKKPKRRKKSGRKRNGLQKCQLEPESNVMEEEKYHLKNSLYTSCKLGDVDSLKSLLAVFLPTIIHPMKQSCDKENESMDVCDSAQDVGIKSGRVQSEEVKDLDGNVTSNSVGLVKNVDEITDNTTKDVNVKSMTESTTFKDRLGNLDFNNGAGIEVRQQVMLMGNSKNTGSEKLRFESSHIDSDRNSVVTDLLTDAAGEISDVIPERDKLRFESSSKVIQDSSDSSCQQQENISNSSRGLCNNDLINGDQIMARMKDVSDVSDCLSREKISDKNLSDDFLTTDENTKTVFAEAPDDLKFKEKDMESSLNIKPETTQPDLSPVVTVAILNEPFGDSDTTLLHVAAREGHKSVIELLMESGASPAVKDKAGQTPYMASKDKTVRNVFRKFVGKWPEKYDYVTAQIPGPLSEEKETEKKKKEAERRKVRQKEKKERLKVKKEEEDRKKAEEAEKNRYLNLSDREKRALAAERRLLQQVSHQGGDKPILNRCFQCAEDISGKVPFEYSDFKFCSPKCLQLHRKSKTTRS